MPSTQQILTTWSWSIAVVLLGIFAPTANADYIERFTVFNNTSNSTWQTTSLAGAPHNVPANAVVQIACVNTKSGDERWAGVREVGGANFERRMRLDQAEDDGVDVMVMHVQTNASSQVQSYAQDKDEVDFYLLGYWDRGVYVEAWAQFEAEGENAWETEGLVSEGIPPDSIAEILIFNEDGSRRDGGIRELGSTNGDRWLEIDKKKKNENMITMWARTDGSVDAEIEVYTEKKDKVMFKALGYWSEPPGVWVEKWEDMGVPTADTTWEALDLSGTPYFVPPNAVATFLIGNRDGSPRNIGIREYGMTTSRMFDFGKSDGSSLDGMHVHSMTEGASLVEWYAEKADTNDSGFYLTGYWEPLRDMLFVVTDPASPTAGETTEAAAYFDTYHYWVTMIDSFDNQTNYNTQFALNDVVMIGEDISSTDLNTKATAAAIGIVNEEIALNDDLEFADAGSNPSASSITIDVGNHGVTAGLGAGAKTIVTSSQSMTGIGAGQAPYLDVLANYGGTDTLGVLEAGGLLRDRTRAAGRRVALPWAGAAFDFTTLNANGQTLLQDSLDWASSLVAWWRFDDGSGTTATDSVRDVDGTIAGATWIRGKIDEGLDFDGVNDMVTVSADPRLDFRGDVTMSLWFELDTAFTSADATSRVLAAKYTDADHNFVLGLVGTDYTQATVADGSIVFKFEKGARDVLRYKWTTTTSWNACEWYHLCIVTDGANGANNKIYINGVDVTNGTSVGGSGSAAVDWSWSEDLTIGGGDADQLPSIRYFDGKIDDVRIYRQALTQPEIDALEKLGRVRIAMWQERER